tara:strand:- start:430 stop:654 length:225 start_codon:yes stop_codon:yes gene_type:complete
MKRYLTECCDTTPIFTESTSNWSDNLTKNRCFGHYVTSITGLCPTCNVIINCYEDEDSIDWGDELEYISNHMED